MPKQKAKKIVISLHGIRTSGLWQKEFTPYVSELGWKHYPLDYGFFLAVSLLQPWKHEKKVTWLRNELNRINKENPGIRPSIIVHSFGSLVLGKVLKKYVNIKLDKIVLTGSIIHTEYDWSMLIKEGQVGEVYNIIGEQDFWSGVAQRFVRGAGRSGKKGFSNSKSIVQKNYKEFGHGDAHSHEVFQDEIVPFLAKPSVFDDGTTPQNYLTQVASFEAACWSAITYYRQYLNRLVEAIRYNHFFSIDGKLLSVKPQKLVVAIPDRPSGANPLARERFQKDLNLIEIRFGSSKGRYAFMDDHNILYDLPSIINSFDVFRELNGSSGEADDALTQFSKIIEELCKDIGSNFIEVKTVNEIHKKKGISNELFIQLQSAS